MRDDTKQVRIGKRSFTIQSLGKDDEYHATVADGYGESFYRFCKDQLPKGAVVLDIGANIGLTSCIFSQLASEVYSVEPNPDVFDRLSHNVRSNGLEHVTPINLAISDIVGEVRFSGISAYGHISDDPNGHLVKANTVDNLVREYGIERVDFIKIDVEGFEPYVLRGARETIEKFNPIIFVEFNSWALMTSSGTNPLEFATEIFKNFEKVFIVDNSDNGFSTIASARDVVGRNVCHSGSVDDLILLKRARVLNAPPRVLSGPSPDVVEALSRQVETLSRENDALQAALTAVKSSTSWRITKPIRVIKRALGGR